MEKDKLKALTFPTRLLMVSLEVSKASKATTRWGSALAQDLIFHLDWSIRWNDTYLDLVTLEIEQGCVTPQDYSGFASTSSNDLKGLIFESIS